MYNASNWGPPVDVPVATVPERGEMKVPIPDCPAGAETDEGVTSAGGARLVAGLGGRVGTEGAEPAAAGAGGGVGVEVAWAAATSAARASGS